MRKSRENVSHTLETLPATDTSNVLVATRSATSVARDLVKDTITDDALKRKNVLHVSLTEPATEIISHWYQRDSTFPDHLAIISATDTTRSPARQPESESHIRYPYITTVDDPSDLATIGKTTVALLKRWDTSGRRTEIDFNSVSALLDQCSRHRVFRFLHTYMETIKQTDATCYYQLEVTACDEASTRAIRGLFDTIVTVDPNGDLTVTT